MGNEALTDPLRETLGVFAGTEPLTTQEVSEALGLNRRTAYARLDRLADGAHLLTKKVGANARVWWRPNRPAGVATHPFEVRTDDLLDHVLDDVDVGMLMVEESGEVAWMNEAAETYFQANRRDVIGRQRLAVVAEQLAPATANPEAFVEALRSTYASPGTSEFECRVTAGDRARWLEHRSKPIETGALAGGRIELYYDTTELRLTQEASRERREEFHSLVKAVEDYAIFTLGPSGHVRSWNPGARRIKGYGADEILGEHFSTFYPEEAREAGVPERNLQIAAGDGSLEDTGWRVRKDGSRFWANVTISAIRDDTGELTGFAKVTRDMTRQREYERRLERQAERLERQRDDLERELEDIFRRIEDAYIAIDGDGRITFANERAVDLVEQSAGEMIGTPVWEAFPDLDEGHPRERVERALGRGEDVAFEFRSAPLDAWLEIRCFPSEGGLSMYVRDVTERKAHEAELLRTNTQLEAATNAGQIGTWDWRIREDEFFADEWFARLFDVDPESIREGVSLERLLTRVHEEDRERVERAIEAAIDGCGTYEEECRLRDGNGDLRWIVARGEVACDEDGNPLHFPGAAMDITERKRSEVALEKRSDQQRAVADLGQLALADQSLDRLMGKACEGISDVLNHEFCQVLELNDGAGLLRVREGVGWPHEHLESGAISTGGRDTLARLVLEHQRTVTVEDLREEDRFDAPEAFTDHGVHSGISTLIGPPEDPWGILGTYDTAPGAFTREDEIFVRSMANVLANAIDRAQREARLAARRDELATLNHLNAVVTDLTDAAIEGSTRNQIEEIVCEALAASPAYAFAWIAEADPHADALRERASAEAEGYPDQVTIPLDRDGSDPMPPGVAAIRDRETQVVRDVRDDERVASFRDVAEAHGFAGLASIPIVHEGTVYGVLGVYTERENAFDEAEVDVIDKLGRIVGHAIAATERQLALMSDELVELEFRIRDPFGDRPDPPVEGTIELEHAVPLGDDAFVIYGSAPPETVEGLEEVVDDIASWEAMSIREEGDPTRFELRAVESPILSLVASVGGYIERAAVEGGQLELTVHLAPSTDVRQLIEAIEGEHPDAEMVRRRQITRPAEEIRPPQRQIVGDLTDRQREVLEIALHSGYFEWPREASGEEVAETIGIAPATFSQHLRRAQQHVFDRLLPHPT